MRRAFTLIELLVVIGIMGLMVTVGIVSIRSGQGSARVKGAARDIFATIRHARSTALVTQQPAIVTYSTEKLDGEPVARVEITSTRLFGEDSKAQVTTITGAPVARDAEEAPASGGDVDEASSAGEKGGNTVEEILFQPVASDIVKGMRVKVVMGSDLPDAVEPVRKSRVSVFSNVDYLLGRYREAKKSAQAEAMKSQDSEVGSTPLGAEEQEPVSVVWETNGRVEPHQVWIYPDGKKPEDGLLIRIDRFGGARIVNGDGREDE